MLSPARSDKVETQNSAYFPFSLAGIPSYFVGGGGGGGSECYSFSIGL